VSTSTVKTAVKGGFVIRNAKTGRFVEVGTSSGTKRAKPKTFAADGVTFEELEDWFRVRLVMHQAARR